MHGFIHLIDGSDISSENWLPENVLWVPSAPTIFTEPVVVRICNSPRLMTASPIAYAARRLLPLLAPFCRIAEEATFAALPPLTDYHAGAVPLMFYYF